MTPRQLLDLWVAQRAVDLGHEFVADSQQVDGGLRRVVAAAAIALLCRAAFLAAAISGDDGTLRAFAATRFARGALVVTASRPRD